MSPSSSEVARYYSELQVKTASHAKRICMLHARCVELVMMADDEHEELKRRLLLDKAQNIISQLQAVLRIDDAVSQGLFYLYDYCYNLLQRGDSADIRSAADIVIVLRNCFEQLLRTT